jgi:hypothetical protein
MNLERRKGARRHAPNFDEYFEKPVSMKFRSSLPVLLFPAFLLCLPSVLTGAAGKLNILLIVSDDRRDTVGCNGNAAVRTPNLDRLSACRDNPARLQRLTVKSNQPSNQP